MRKYLSALLTILIFSGTLYFPQAAENGCLFDVSDSVIAKGKTAEYKFDEAYKRNITVEIEYDLTEISWDGVCNLPFIIVSGTTEMGRMSIFSNDSVLLETKTAASSFNTGTVERKGAAIIEVDYDNRMLVYKWKGSGVKTKTVLGYGKFAAEPYSGISSVKIGASGNPGVTVNIRVYDTVTDERRTDYSFDSAYGVRLNDFAEFSRGTDGVTTAPDPTDKTNGILKVPAGETLDMVFMPIDLGFSGNIKVKYRVFAAYDGDCAPALGELREYITGSTKSVVRTRLSNPYKLTVTGDNSSKYTADSKKYLNRWIETEYLFDTEKNTVQAYADGRKIVFEDNDENISIADIGLINRLYVCNTDCDIYIDDISISEIKIPQLHSDTLKINEEKGIISGIADNAMCESLTGRLTAENGSIKIISADGTEKTGALCAGDRLVLYGNDSMYTKQYVIAGYSEDIPQSGKRTTPIYHIENQTVPKGQNKTFAIGGTYNENIAVEADYNLGNTTWSGDCNIPIIMLDENGGEVGRISIFSSDAEILSTRMENGNYIITTGGIGRYGTIRLETDFAEKRLIFKYSGAGYKQMAALGYIAFKNADISGISGVKIGATANPGITVDMRVYKENPAALKTEYNFNSSYSGDLSQYYDFNLSDSGVILASDPKNEENRCVYVPQNKKIRMDVMPRDYGFSGDIRIKYGIYLTGDVKNAEIAAWQEYITGSTKDIIKLKALNGTELEFSSCDNKYTVQTEPFEDRWIEIEYFLKLEENKAFVKAGGKAVTDDWFDIPQTTLINQLQTKNTVCDMYLDDLEISDGGVINIFSDAYAVDNESRTISGADITDETGQFAENINSNGNVIAVVNEKGEEKSGRLATGDMLKVTCANSGYSVHYAIEYRNRITDFENSLSDRFEGGMLTEAPYGGHGRALRSVGSGKMTVYFPTDGEYNTAEFELCFENNTARRAITVDNANNRQFSKMYLYNQESAAFLVGDETQNHIITTEDRTWHRYKITVDKESQKVSWFIDGRPLQNEPFDFANLYDGENTFASVSIENNESAYSYIDNIVVSKAETVNLTVESTDYAVDNTYFMITGIPQNTRAENVISKISPKGYIVSADGRKKSRYDYIMPGDAIRFEANRQKVEYALGADIAEANNTAGENQTTIYVSESDGTGTLEEAFKTAEKTDGNVKIVITGNEFKGGSCIKNIMKENGNITLTSEAVISGGNTLSFRKLNESEKEIFIAAPEKILCADISEYNLGKTVQSGWNLPFVPSSAKLTVNGITQTVARYPNEGYIKSGDIVSSSAQQLIFQYADERSETWRNYKNARIWSHFDVTYGGHDAEISNINMADKTVALSGNMYSTNISSPIEYYYYNIPEELDAPGEYYIDKENKLLYYYPNSDISRAILTDGTDALLRFENCRNIIINGITFDGGLGNGIEINGCDNVTVKNCEVSGSGMNGIVISGGMNCGVKNSAVHHTDGDAVKLSGGDIYTLTRANHYVDGCDIHDFSLRKKSYTSAVTTAGCGHAIKNNRIYNAPHTGLFIRSSETEIASNSFKNLTYDAMDMGCIYSVDTYTRRGISIHDNYFEGIRNRYGDKSGLVKCIYMDNYTSGWEIYNNVFRDCDQGIHANGGRENTVRDNLFVSVDYPLGMYNLLNSFLKPPMYQTNLSPVSSGLWTARYKGINEITETYPGYPYGTSVYGNVIAGGKVNSVSLDAYMFIEDSEIISAEKIKNGKIQDYDFCNRYVRNIADNINEDSVVIDGLIPFCGELRMTKGENKAVAVRIDGKYAEPALITSSNEIVVRASNGNISAVNPGIADITVKYGDYTETIRVTVKK